MTATEELSKRTEFSAFPLPDLLLTRTIILYCVRLCQQNYWGNTFQNQNNLVTVRLNSSSRESMPTPDGSGWESNPPGPALRNPSDGFEDRGAHQDSTAPIAL